MRKTSTKTKNTVVQENQKISSFFKKIPQNKSTAGIKIKDEDVIPATPDVTSIKSKKVLSPITNRDEEAMRKRKFSPNSSSAEKMAKRKNENFDPHLTDNCSSGRSPSKKSSPRKSRSPKKKLFETSPNTSDFKVEVINNFVMVSPSKSSHKSMIVSSPKSNEKKQISILNYVSPSLSSRVVRAQIENETTPVKTPSKHHLPSTSKVKMQLKFEELKTQGVPENNTKEQSTNSETLQVFGDSITFFDDINWDNLNLSLELYTLDLQKPQHCKVISYSTLERNKLEIIVKSTKSEDRAKCVLEGFWVSTKIKIDAVIYLNAVKIDGIWKVTSTDGLLVYEPDLLISSTSVVGALFCKRRSVFKDRFYGFEPENKVMIVGILVHTLLQNVLKSKADTVSKVETILKALLTTKDLNRMLYNTSLKLSEIKEEITQFVPRIVEFIQSYITNNRGKYSKKCDNWTGHIDSIQDIEENIWCPELGMKGKVDVSLTVKDQTLPLELKTGRATVSLEHRGQVMIYIMMMLKLGYKVSSGLLLYLKEGTLREIPYNEHEKRDIILLRNELAYYLKQKIQIKKHNNDNGIKSVLEMPELPEPIKHHSACGKCPYNIICCSYLRHEKIDISTYKHLNEVNTNVLSHLNESHIEYFIHWSNLLDLESSQQVGKDISTIYRAIPQQREKEGRSLTSLQIKTCTCDANGLYNHIFERISSETTTTFLVSGLGESSYVVVSTDTRAAISTGFVTFIDHNSIEVALERNLQEKYPNATFHIDTYDSNSVNSFNLSNLAILLEPTDRARELRSFIIEKTEATFSKKLPQIVANKAPSVLKHLNNVQQRAVLRALTAQDYVLIKGMPGTGKTATIVALVELLTEIGQTVLITSYTHNAVDNVCLRLRKRGIKVLRLGSQGRIHSELREMSEHELTKNCNTVEELENVYNNAKILAVTCLGSKHPALSKRTMDVCLVDESTQALQCSLIRVLSVCKKFVLIGDPDQLPPIVKNKEASARGMSESLFERLQNEKATITLNINYRMNTTITNIANKYMYNGELRIGSEDVANACLSFSKPITEVCKEKWISEILSTKLEEAVKIVDTGETHSLKYKPKFSDKLIAKAFDDSEQLKCSNLYETAIIYRLVEALLKGGVSKHDIGVIAPYRAQVAQLSTVLAKMSVEVSTVDQFQGQDKSVIIYSCTKSGKESKITKFDILEDRRRLNVAITRAKHKLIIIGDVQTIRRYSTFSKLFESIHSNHFLCLENGKMDFEWETAIDIDLE